ncbi:MAG: DUF2147 domain-containing protein [Bacteroidetes bacterium]|nr:DUF2147 domain-containing protein [Bacteroidota bacterium]
MLAATVLFAVPTVLAQDVKGDDVIGTWLNEDEDAHIQITKRDNQFFGKVSWIKDPIDSDTGEAKLDKLNPDESLRSRPKLGLEIFTSFNFNGDDRWDNGKIYNPKSGKTYKCYIELRGIDKIKIRGFIGATILGKTTYWTRVK